MQIDAFDSDISSIEFLSPRQVAELNMARFYTVQELAAASLNNIADVRLIGSKTAIRIHDELRARGMVVNRPALRHESRTTDLRRAKPSS